MVKKLMVLTSALFLALTLCGSALAAPVEKVVFQPGNNKYIIDGTELTMNAVPFIAEGRTFVPVRFLARALGAKEKHIGWDKATGTVSLVFRGDNNGANNMEIAIQPGSHQLLINYLDAEAITVLSSKTVPMDVTPVLRDGRMYLPARWVAEARGFRVEWDGNYQGVLVYTPGITETPTDEGEVNVDTRETKSTTDQMELNMQLPVITGMADKALQEKINQEILDKAMQTKSELESLYGEYAADAVKYNFPAHSFQLHVSYEAHTSGDILSLVVLTYQFTGGAHGQAWKDYYILDTQQGVQLALQDLFDEHTDYVSIINGEIKKQIADQMNSGEAMYFEGEMGFTSITENHPFYIKDNQLMICFGQYEIAPYAAGMPEFAIPMDFAF